MPEAEITRACALTQGLAHTQSMHLLNHLLFAVGSAVHGEVSERDGALPLRLGIIGATSLHYRFQTASLNRLVTRVWRGGM